MAKEWLFAGNSIDMNWKYCMKVKASVIAHEKRKREEGEKKSLEHKLTFKLYVYVCVVVEIQLEKWQNELEIHFSLKM